MSILKSNINFKGSLNDFIIKIKECLISYNIDDEKISERLVRYYITEAIIPRPVRDGKEYSYNYEHLLKFLYARRQIMDGWPLSKLKEIIKFEENQYFENYLNTETQYSNRMDSMSLIETFKMETQSIKSKIIDREINPIRHQEQIDIPNLQDALFAIDSDLGNVVKQKFTTLQLSSWLVLLIENYKLSEMTYELSKKIGEAISASLIEKNPMSSSELRNQFSNYKDNVDLQYQIGRLEKENDLLKYRLEEKKERDQLIKAKEISELELLIKELGIKSHLNSQSFSEREKLNEENMVSIKNLNEEIKIYNSKNKKEDLKILTNQITEIFKTFSNERDNLIRERETSDKLLNDIYRVSSFLKNTLSQVKKT